MQDLFNFTEGKFTTTIAVYSIHANLCFSNVSEEMTDEPEVCPQLIPDWYRQ